MLIIFFLFCPVAQRVYSKKKHVLKGRELEIVLPSPSEGQNLKESQFATVSCLGNMLVTRLEFDPRRLVLRTGFLQITSLVPKCRRSILPLVVVHELEPLDVLYRARI